MKRVLSILLALLLLAAPGCQAPLGEESTVVVNDLPGVYCEIVEGTLTPTGAEVRFWNTLDREDLLTGLEHYLEAEHGGTWYSMDHLRTPPNPWDTVGFPIFPESSGQQFSHYYNWGAFYPPLEAGHYRIIFPYHEGSGKGIQHHILAAEFTIQ